MKVNGIAIIDYILIIVFCTTRFWGVNLPWYINLIVRLLFIGMFILINNLKITISKKVLKCAWYTVFPIIMIIVYTLLLWGVSSEFLEANIVRNLFTSNIYLIISVIFGALIYQKYKKKTVDIFVNCSFISYIFGSIIPLLVKYKLEGLKYLITATSSNYDLLYYTEVNDLTFGIGICLIFYLFFDSKNNKHYKVNILKCLVMIFWGLKRIQIVALILCYLFYRIIITKFNMKKASMIVTGMIIFVSYLYVMFIHNNELIALASKYNINFMGRLPTYLYVSSHYSKFSPTFLGIGFGRIDEILNELVSMDFRIDYIPVISLHSDILRMYIGIGFIMFGVWIFYQCYYKTKIIKKNVGFKCSRGYLLFTVYIFILYLTDNTYSYPITFTLYFICVLCCIEENLAT